MKSSRLNFVDKAFKVTDIKQTISGIRALVYARLRCIWMPFKQEVIQYLDELAESATKTGAVNTIVNDGYKLTGHNTDYIAALITLETLNLKEEEPILVLGAGGVSRAIIVASNEIGCRNIMVSDVTTQGRNY
jgi:shikimate dehydrogenase